MPDELTEHDVELITRKNFAHIVTLMADGSPQVSPVWVDVADGLIVVNTAEGRVKPRNVRRDPRVAVSIMDRDDPYDILMVRGRVVEITNDGAAEHIDAMAKKYTGAERYPAHDPEHPRVIIRIRPERIARMR